MVGPVEDGDIPIGDLLLCMQVSDLVRDPLRLLRSRLGVVADRNYTAFQGRDQIFFHTDGIFADQGIGRRQNGGCGPVIVHHHDGPGSRIVFVEIQQVFDIGPAPGVDRLVRITDDKEVFVHAAQDGHELILEVVDVLEFIDHDVFQPALPFSADFLVL